MNISFKDLGISKGIVSYDYVCKCLYLLDEKYRKNNLVMTFDCGLIIRNYFTKSVYDIKENFSWWVNNPAYYSYILINVDDDTKIIKIFETEDIYPFHIFSKNFVYYRNQIMPAFFALK